MYPSANKLPSVEFLKERFEIDPSVPSGLRYKTDPKAGWRKAGDIAGRKTGSGYYQTSIQGYCYQNSRIIWKMVNGSDPENVIDHIDNNKSNNSISNLRDVTQRVNCLNRRDFKASKEDFVAESISSKENSTSLRTYFRNIWRTIVS